MSKAIKLSALAGLLFTMAACCDTTTGEGCDPRYAQDVDALSLTAFA